jgi:hypothetical protein
MVKSAVRGMDAVQEFSKKTLNHDINRFVVPVLPNAGGQPGSREQAIKE